MKKFSLKMFTLNSLLVSALFCAALLNFAASATPALAANTKSHKEFMDHFPQNQSFVLSSGERVLLPTHFNEIEGLNIIGTVRKEVAQAVLDQSGYAQDFELVTVPGGRVMTFLALLITTRHDFGPHNDFGINFVIKAKNKIAEVAEQDDRGPFTLVSNDVVAFKIYGNLEISNKADREIWAIDKHFATVDTRASTATWFDSQFKDAQGTWGQIRFEKPVHAPRVPLLMKTVVYSLLNPTKVAPVFFKGKFALLPGADRGSIEFNPAHPVGAQLYKLDFKPLIWQYGTGLQGAYLPPLR